MTSTPIAWAKLAANLHSNRRIRKAGHLGRAVYVFVLCCNAGRGATGTMPATELEVWYLADQLLVTLEEAQRGVDAALTAGLISIDGENVSICGWETEWGKRPLTEAERKRIQRARVKSPDTVQTSDGTSSGPEVPCPECPTGEESRGEKRRAPADTAGTAPLSLSADPEPAQELAAIAIGEINRLAGTHYEPTSKRTLKDCKTIAKASPSPTAEQVRAVIGAKWSEWRGDDKMRRHFTPWTLLRPNKFAQYLEDLTARAGGAQPRPARVAGPEKIVIDGKVYDVPDAGGAV